MDRAFQTNNFVYIGNLSFGYIHCISNIELFNRNPEQAVPLDDGATPLIPMLPHCLKIIMKCLIVKTTNHLGAEKGVSMFPGHSAEIQL